MAGLLCLKLCPVPKSPLPKARSPNPTLAYVIRATWPDFERAKYEDRCKATVAAAGTPITPATPATTASTQPVASAPPLNIEEKEWLKQKSGFGNELLFLRANGLSIYKEEDREEGRQIVRAFIAKDEEEEEEDEDEEEGEDEEWDPIGHQVDYAFTREELEFMERGVGVHGERMGYI